MTATATAEQANQLAPPADIMPVEKSNGRLLPTKSEIEILRELANDMAASGQAIGGCRMPGAYMYKMLLGWEHGIRPATSLTAIDVIEGRGTLTALTLAATVEARGIGSIDLVDVNDDGATVRVTRADRGPDWFKLVMYTKADAAAAKFISLNPDGTLARDPKTGAAISEKKNWRTNTHDMFVARAIARAYRRWFRVAALGLPYTREELEDGAEEDGRPISVQLEQPKPNWITSTSDAPVPAPAAASIPPGASVPPAAAPEPARVGLSDPQSPAAAAALQAIAANALQAIIAKAKDLYVELGVTKDQWSDVMKAYGHTSLKEFSPKTAQEVLDLLQYTSWVRQLRAVLNYDPAGWAAVLKKYQAAHDLQLALPTVKSIYQKLADLKTPFELADLGIGPPPSGTSLGNVSSPPANETQQPVAGTAAGTTAHSQAQAA